MKDQRGFTLIETAIAVGFIGIIAAVLLSAQAGVFGAHSTVGEHTTSQSLAKSQMEYIKAQDYIAAPDGGESTYQKISTIPPGYTINSVNRTSSTVGDIVAVPWDSETGTAVDSDAGLQRIELVITYNGEVVSTLEGYKVDR